MRNNTVNKVHFAGCDVLTKAVITKAAGASYALFSAYPHIINTINKPYMNKRQETQEILPRWICANFKHVILDSGLFSFLFGGKKGTITGLKQIQRWQSEYIRFIKKYGYTGTVVECDAQYIVGYDNIWKLRDNIRTSIPNQIIYVWHKQDGQKGLDRLIDYCDYLGVSFSEYKGKDKDYRDYVHRLVGYILNKKPGMKIHLLGMTDAKTLGKRIGIYSSDSTSHLTGARYGRIAGFHVQQIKSEGYEEARDMILAWFRTIPEFNGYKLPAKRMEWFVHLYIAVKYYKQLYEKLAGNQD